jgi:hypothetical protein
MGVCWARCSAGLLLLSMACSSSGDDSNFSFAPEDEGTTPNAGGPSPGSNNPGVSPGGATDGNDQPAEEPDPPPPPEVESERSFQVPVVTGSLIWAANPDSGRVALVDAVTREVQTLAAGLGPRYLAAIEGDGDERAIVINTGSFDATLFREASDGALSDVDIAIHVGANAWATSAGGRWAVAWSDASREARLDPTEGLQDVSVIDLSAARPVAQRFSVGYRPVALTIDAEESRLYAVTQSGISVIALGDEPRLQGDVTILSSAEELAGDAGAPVLDDVPISADGRFALVRFAGAERLKVLDLASGESQVLELPGEVSDVDIAGDGRRAVAVIRATSQVVTFDLAAVLEDASALILTELDGAAIGSVSLPESGSHALLFTNAVPSDQLAIFDQSAPENSRVVSLKAPIDAVFPAPDGSHAIALLTPDADSVRAGAFSVVPVDESLPPKIQGTDAPPFQVSVADTRVGVRGLVTTRQDAGALYAVYLARMPSLQVDRIELASPPIATGILPELGIGFVAQEHPEGRITFIDLETAEPETLTGFELATRVVSGGKP